VLADLEIVKTLVELLVFLLFVRLNLGLTVFCREPSSVKVKSSDVYTAKLSSVYSVKSSQMSSNGDVLYV
jgi:hypothetical protein